MIWLRTVLFTLLVPGTVMGVVPFALIVSGVGPHFEGGFWDWFRWFWERR